MGRLLLGQNFQKCREALQTQNPPRPTKIKKLSETSATSNTSRPPDFGSGTPFFSSRLCLVAKKQECEEKFWKQKGAMALAQAKQRQESWNCSFLRGYERMQICGNFEEFWLNRILNSLGWQCNEFCFIHFYPTSNFKKILISTSVLHTSSHYAFLAGTGRWNLRVLVAIPSTLRNVCWVGATWPKGYWVRN